MSKLYGTWRRCIFCEYWSKRHYNIERHVIRKHTGDRELKYFRLMQDGTFECRLHQVPIKYGKREHLHRHLYFCHRGEDFDFLITNGLDPQKVESLCKDCKGTLHEYG
jgi:hypothetical protein